MHPAPAAAARRGRGGWLRDPPGGRTAASLARPPETGSLGASALRAEAPPPPHARLALPSRLCGSLIPPQGAAPRGRIPGWEGPGRQRGAPRESVRAARPSGAGQREPPERQRRRRRRRQHPPRSAPALGVAAAGRHECYYIERRCRSIALSQWQGATGLILRAVRGVHLSPAASPRTPPPPPPGPTAAPGRPRVGARGERAAPRAAPRRPRARDATVTAGGGRAARNREAADSSEVGAEGEMWRHGDVLPLSRGRGEETVRGVNKLIIQDEKPSASNCRVSRQVPAAASLLR
uniref:Uncharacterized protein n=1 Tax=Rangifer tarandus platyrhynchus TaxID=3082113 RepID=A0ACB0DZ80_RANTA|nr:unnamed protein product [Rangifer tarandus platyrhynchus]